MYIIGVQESIQFDPANTANPQSIIPAVQHHSMSSSEQMSVQNLSTILKVKSHLSVHIFGQIRRSLLRMHRSASNLCRIKSIHIF